MLNVSVELVVSGARVNIQDNEGRTALMYAAENGHVDMSP